MKKFLLYLGLFIPTLLHTTPSRMVTVKNSAGHSITIAYKHPDVGFRGAKKIVGCKDTLNNGESVTDLMNLDHNKIAQIGLIYRLQGKLIKIQVQVPGDYFEFYKKEAKGCK